MIDRLDSSVDTLRAAGASLLAAGNQTDRVPRRVRVRAVALERDVVSSVAIFRDAHLDAMRGVPSRTRALARLGRLPSQGLRSACRTSRRRAPNAGLLEPLPLLRSW